MNLSSFANELSWFDVGGRYNQLEYADALDVQEFPKKTIVFGTNSTSPKLDIGAGPKCFYRIRVSESPSAFD